MKNILFILAFIYCIQPAFATGLNDWNYKTGRGIAIADPGDGPKLYTNTGNVLPNLTRWYFYEDHIIGEYDTFINPEYKTAYFIVNELTGTMSTYDTPEHFERAVKTQNLEPIFWTRWYYDHYTILQFIFVLFIFSWPIASAVFLFTALFIFLSIALKHRTLKKICIVITALLLVPPVLFMLNDYYVYSI